MSSKHNGFHRTGMAIIWGACAIGSLATLAVSATMFASGDGDAAMWVIAPIFFGFCLLMVPAVALLLIGAFIDYWRRPG